MEPVIITRTAETRWQAVSDGRTVGHGDLAHRPDGRLFVSVDVWRDPVFDRLAAAVLADLPGPVHTLVAEDDPGLAARWERLGFTVGRREREYTVPTAPTAPTGVAVLPGTEADPERLRALEQAIRAEVEATVGWRTMPAEILPGPVDTLPLDPAKYAVAVRDGRYAGLVRVAAVRRRARIGLVAVRADDRRRGIGRALLAHALGSLHRQQITSAWAEVDAANPAGIALFEGAGAERTGGCIELVRR
ncbi:GNAT family N-acetyltransferase [Streptomyces sp. NPDC001594]|uniref:GNAT family N-acetyltransferase n=1 Tax=Streptomyces sp. NPDC001594 TaxID=3364590 RepID=UPI003674ADE1